jgi:hypothetical protein
MNANNMDILQMYLFVSLYFYEFSWHILTLKLSTVDL